MPEGSPGSSAQVPNTLTGEERKYIPPELQQIGSALETGNFSYTVGAESERPVKVTLWKRSVALEAQKTLNDPILDIALNTTKAVVLQKKPERLTMDLARRAWRHSRETGSRISSVIREIRDYERLYQSEALVNGKVRKVQFVGALPFPPNKDLWSDHGLEIGELMPRDSIFVLDHSHSCINVVTISEKGISGITLLSIHAPPTSYRNEVVRLLHERGIGEPGSRLLYSGGLRDDARSIMSQSPGTNGAVKALTRAVEEISKTTGFQTPMHRVAPRAPREGTTMLFDGKNNAATVILNDCK